jgi:hypothetical protein
LFRVELRVLPYRNQFRVADCIGPDGIGDLHGITHGWQFAIGVRFALSGPYDVVDLILRCRVQTTVAVIPARSAR